MTQPYLGLWKRASLQLGEQPAQETEQVYWLQGYSHFADLRIPLNYPTQLVAHDRAALLPLTTMTAFAGTTQVYGNQIEWHHTIDFKPQPHSSDQGTVHWDGGDLIEVGEWIANGQMQSYRERWVPQPLDHPDFYALELVKQINHTTQTTLHPLGKWVVVGQYFLRLIDFRPLPKGWVTPELEQLGLTELQQFLQFQAEFGYVTGQSTPWCISASNWADQVGRSLRDRAAYQTTWQGDFWIEQWCQDAVFMERHWRVCEASDEGRMRDEG